MVTKRELAAAQQALNEAVAAFLDVVPPETWTGDDGVVTQRAYVNLLAAYDEWNGARRQLDGDGPAVARSTSIAAGKANIMAKQSLRRTILSMVVNHYRHYGVGCTTDAIQSRLKGKHQSVSARVSELVNTYGLLVDSGHKYPTSSGAKAIAWNPTQEAIDLVRAAETGAE